MRRLTFTFALILSAAGLGHARAARAQEPGWNGARALDLVERARERRRQPMADTALRSYRADVDGYIYFLLDREGQPEPVLLRADQVALLLYWGRPNRTKQIIRGMRSEEQFPIKDFRYYLDRYTVIQNGFGDVIRVGEGRDVRNVPHPLSPGADSVYDYRLVDSTTIRLPGQPEPIRVYEIQVRPQDFGRPAIIGSLFVERSRSDLVRLAFTFTPSAYIDPRNQRVEIMLENALWEGKYWLPREQRLLVRREIPELDIGLGTVIRAALRVKDYTLNPDLPPDFFTGRPVVLGETPRQLAQYPFEKGLYEGYEDVGLAPGTNPGSLDDVDVHAIAGRILRQRYLGGLSRVRPYAPAVSSILRYDRSEGLVTGAGVSVALGRTQLHGYGARAWGDEALIATIGWRSAPPGVPGWSLDAYRRRPLDLGLRPGAAGVTATASALATGEDYRDIARSTGGTVTRSWGQPARGRLSLAAGAEWQDPYEQAATTPPLDRTGRFRPAAPVTPGVRLLLSGDYERELDAGPFQLRVHPRIEAGEWSPDPGRSNAAPEEGAFGRALVDAEATWRSDRYSDAVRVRATAAAAFGATPPQQQWLLGGRNTLPGYDFHAFVGERAIVLDVAGWRTVVPHWLQLRALAAAGWAGPGSASFAPHLAEEGLEPWTPRATGGIAASVGVGLGSIDGIVRLDYAVPIGAHADGRAGTLIFSVDPRLWSFL